MEIEVIRLPECVGTAMARRTGMEFSAVYEWYLVVLPAAADAIYGARTGLAGRLRGGDRAMVVWGPVAVSEERVRVFELVRRFFRSAGMQRPRLRALRLSLPEFSPTAPDA